MKSSRDFPGKRARADLGVFLLVSLLGSFSSLFIPYVNTDEGAWASMSQYAFSGDLYRLFTDHKPPGLYEVYWLFSGFGHYPVLTHWTTSLWMGIGAYFMFLFLKKRFDESSARIVCIFFALLNPLVEFGAFSPERVYLPLIIISIWLADRQHPGIEIRAVIIGFILGLASAIKQPAVMLGLVPAMMLLSQEKKLRVFFLGLTFGTLAILLTWWLTQVSFQKIWAEGYLVNLTYMEGETRGLSGVWLQHLTNGGLVLVVNFFPLLWGTIFGFRRLLDMERRGFVLFFLMCSIIPIILGGRFYQNYFVNLLPFLTYAASAYWTREKLKQGLVVAVSIVIGFNCLSGVRQFSDKNKNWDSNVQRLIREVKQDTLNTDRIWIVHNLFSVYFETQRLPSTPLIFFHQVLGYIDICRVENNLLRENLSNENYLRLLDDLSQHPPKVVYWPQRKVNSCTDRLKIESFPSLQKIIDSNYQLKYQDALGRYYLRSD